MSKEKKGSEVPYFNTENRDLYKLTEKGSLIFGSAGKGGFKSQITTLTTQEDFDKLIEFMKKENIKFQINKPIL